MNGELEYSLPVKEGLPRSSRDGGCTCAWGMVPLVVLLAPYQHLSVVTGRCENVAVLWVRLFAIRRQPCVLAEL